jgi:hypothetical protein
MNSCGLLRTNTGLTTNLKLVVGSNYALFLDSIVSTPELSQSRYKKYQFDKDSYWDDLVSIFFQNTPVDIAYSIKDDSDSSNMSVDFANQYDDLYQYGARNIVDNKYYSEEYEYFAPLYIEKSKLPSNFIIFRIDGPGIINLNKNNFRDEIINKMKVVKNFDLTPITYLGQWINNNITLNKDYPNNSLYIDFRRMEFSTWRGIDYVRGGYTERSFLLDSTFEYEQTYLDMEKLILEGYKNNKIVFPNIINFSFLYDDTPATPTSIRKWSLNRYLGFYLDEMTLSKRVSPNKLPNLRNDVVVDSQNFISSPSSNTPFLNDWEVGDYPYVEINQQFYKIEKIQQTTSSKLQKIRNTRNTFEEKKDRIIETKYRIISDISLNGVTSNMMNKNLVQIDSENNISFQSGVFNLSDFDSADVWLIEIGDLFHRILRVDGVFKIHSDYGFVQSAEKFQYYINNFDPKYTKTIDLVTKKDYGPVQFNIFRCKFSDIKDFDTTVIDTEHSRFEYETDDTLTNTDEPKLYVLDLESTSNPKDLIQFKLQNKVTSIPASSEYTANSETFRIVNNSLSDLWKKNSKRLKWGFSGSISSFDYSYLLNNSSISDGYNRSPNSRKSTIQRSDRNLDHFYTINSNGSKYNFHSLHVEDYQNGVINTNFSFELDKYLGLGYDQDYFSYFFGKKSYFNDSKIIKQSKKYSTFQNGDQSIPNITLFRGLRFKLYEVENTNIVNDRIEKINLKNSNKFYGWKFSILLSNNNHIVTNIPSDLNKATLLKSENVLRWRIIDEWKSEKDYKKNSLVLYDWILYTNPSDSRITDPNLNPSNSNEWVEYQKPTIFYSRYFDGRFDTNNMDYSLFKRFPPLIYHSGEYYYSDGVNVFDFWDSKKTYSIGQIVTYDNKNWKSLTNNNKSIPDENSGKLVNSQFIYDWEETIETTRWNKVPLWRDDRTYDVSDWNLDYFDNGKYVVHNDVVYGSTMSTMYGVSPDLDSNWSRVYSFAPNTNIFYGPNITNNSIIHMNGKYYECVSNSSIGVIDPQITYNYSLDNGIYVIINEKHKNVLVNIYVNDNTYSEVEETSPNFWSIVKNRINNTNRDDIYSNVFTKLSTNNLMNSINDLSNKFNFSDALKYIIVREDSSLEIYDFNDLRTVVNLPYLLNCDPPDEISVRVNSNINQSLTLSPSEIKAKKLLNESSIENLGQLNYYNGMHLASKITQNLQNRVIVPNYTAVQNKLFYRLFRFSGYYSPLLTNIELFDSPTYQNTTTNYKFDTELTNFGIVKERVISKVNRTSNILTLRNSPNLKSMYPMIDEFGYHTVDFFIFKSTWDLGYHYESLINDIELNSDQLQFKEIDVNSPDFRNNNSNLL